LIIVEVVLKVVYVTDPATIKLSKLILTFLVPDRNSLVAVLLSI